MANVKNKIVKAGNVLRNASLMLAVMVTPVFATDSGRLTATQQNVCGFVDNINSLLSWASIAVVTIAIIFAGYQIAFAHKRISDVAPILIGAFLIGAAGQIASMILPDNSEDCSAGSTGTTGYYYVIDSVNIERA